MTQPDVVSDVVRHLISSSHHSATGGLSEDQGEAAQLGGTVSLIGIEYWCE